MAGIGDIGVSVTADVAQFTSGMDRVAQIAETSMRRAEQAQKIATAASDKLITSLQFQAATFGKTDAQVMQYKADLLGAGDAAKPLIAQIEAMSRAAGGAAGSLKGATAEGAHGMNGFSFATAGAKRELLVLAHELSQGNYSKFGGSMLVLGERTGAAALLFSGFGVAALATVGVLGAFAYAAIKGAAESDALSKSLQLTGNFAGTTSSQINSMSMTIAGETTHRIGAARDAISALVATGKFTSTALVPLGQASVDISRLTGKTAEEVAQDFEKMRDGVAQYASKLNDSYHFLSAAQFEHIRQLEIEGKAQEAMAETGRVIDIALKNNDTNLGTLGRALEGARRDWDRFWDAAHDVGREDTTSQKIQRTQAALESAQAGLAARSSIPNLAKIYIDDVKQKQEYIASLNHDLLREQEAGIAKSAAAERQAAGIKASEELDRFHKQYAAKSKQAADEVALYKKAIADRKAAGEGGVDSESKQVEIVAAIRKKYEEHAAKPAAYQDSAAIKLLQNLREQDAVIQDQLKGTGNLTGAQKEQAKFEQLILDLKGKKLTKDQESLLASKDAIRAQLGKNVSDAEELRVKSEILALDEKSAQINLQIASFKNSQQEGFQTRLDAVGMGKDAQSQIAAITQIRKEYRKLQDDLTKSTPADMLGSEKFLEEQATIKAGLESSLAEYKSYYDDLKAKQLDWRNGAAQAFADYRDSASNVAGHVESAMTNAFKGAEDALVAFTMTGKLSFSSMANSMIAELVRIQARMAIAGLAGLVRRAFTGDSITQPLTGGGSMEGDGYLAITGKSTGGPVDAGNLYRVNEAGPELFSSGGYDYLMMGKQGGTITPTDKLGSAMSPSAGGGGAGVSMTTVINVSSNGSSSETSGSSSAQGRALADMVNTKVKEVLMRETRQGGILWSQKARG
jgi:lambda family phage tail tape measure protein